MWVLFALTGPVLWAISTHIDKFLLEKYFRDTSAAVLMVFTAVTGLVALPVIAVFAPGALDQDASAIATMMTSGVLYMGALLLYLLALRKSEASIVAPLFQAPTLWAALMAFVFLGERLTVWQSAGAVLVVVGAVALAFDRSLRLGAIKLRFVLQMLAATFVFALSTVIFKVFAVDDDFWPTTFWTFAGQALFGLAVVLVPNYARQLWLLVRKHPQAVFGISAANELINLGGSLGVRYALLLAPLTLVQAVSSTTTLFVFAFGVLLTLFAPKLGREDLRPRTLLRKGAAAVLVAVGIALMHAEA